MIRVQQWVDRFLFLSVSTGLLVTQLLIGFRFITVHLNLVIIAVTVGVLQAFVSSVTFTGVILLSGVLFVAKLARDPGEVEVAHSEPVVAIVPVYGDANVLSRSVRSLVDSTHPVRVMVVPETDDGASLREARRLAREFEQVRCLPNTRYPGSKAGAISCAVERTDGEYIGVFDADERVAPEFIEHALARLEDADVVQGRTVPRPTGVVEALAYYESVLLSYVGRRLLYRLTGFRMAASRAVVFRRGAYEAVGGYDRSMLTEDYYFAYQCYTEGLTVRELLHAPSTIDAAHSMRDWWGQRKRWARGYVQVFHRLTRDALRPAGYRDVLGLAICGSSLVGGMMLISLLSKFIVLVSIGAGLVTMVPVGTVVLLAACVRYLDHRRGPLDGFGVSWVLAPLLFPLYGVVFTRAVIEYLVGGAGDWYRVAKHA